MKKLFYSVILLGILVGIQMLVFEISSMDFHALHPVTSEAPSELLLDGTEDIFTISKLQELEFIDSE